MEKLNGKTFFRASDEGAVRITVDDKIIVIETFTAQGYSSHHSHYFFIDGHHPHNHRWPYSLIEDALFNEKRESVTDPSLYVNTDDSFDIDETIVIRFDNNMHPINWS